MENLFQIINNLSIKDVLSKLEIRYTVVGSSLGIWENSVLTDGRRVCVQKNYVHDFSGKRRACGGPFAFVKSYLKIDDKGVFEWFSWNFGIMNNSHRNTKAKREERKDLKIYYHRSW